MKWFVLAFAALSLSACAHAPSTPAKPDIALYAMNCGVLHIADAHPFADDHAYDGQSRDMIVPCYLVRHPSGDLLWDTGVPQAIHDAPNHQFESDGFRIAVPFTLTSQLAQLGLTPADIDYLSLSHGHFDHAGNAGLFAQSNWIVDARERAHMFRNAARTDAQQFSAYAALENARTTIIESYDEHDVFGDGAVRIIAAPGHTPGHTMLLIDLPHSGPILLTGDMYHLAESRAHRRVPTFNVNREQTLASMDKVEEIAARTQARVVRQHVQEDFDALPAFPEALR